MWFKEVTYTHQSNGSAARARDLSSQSYIQGVSGGIVNILVGGSMDYSE